MKTPGRAKPICFYLPQFHRIPENDQWWGEGFTEWTLVRSAKPIHARHRQPVAPDGDVGWYDLTDPRIRRIQGEMARRFGVYGFCYYHYWFAGKRLLETPLELMLTDGYPDIPFCLCWANEPWTRTWSGEGDVALQPQRYGGEEDWIAHFDVLHRFLSHPNAITVEKRPLLLIYRPGQISGLASMVQCWQGLAAERGLAGLYLVGVLGNFADNRCVPACLDGGAEHHPGVSAGRIEPLQARGVRVFAMEKVWSELAGREKIHPVQFPGVCFHWDNTPRRRTGSSVYTEPASGRIVGYLAEVARRAAADDELPEPFVFVNSWNEWSEGTYLEPDTATGYRRLEVLRQGFGGPALGFELFPRDTAAESGALRHRDRIDIDALNTLVHADIRADRVLEIGCRNGETGAYAGPFLSASFYRGTDDDPDHVEAASFRLHDSRVRALNDYADHCGEDDGQYDLVLAFDALGYTAEPARVLSGVVSMLRSGGRLLAGFFNRSHYMSVLARKHGGRPDIGFRHSAVLETFSMGDTRALVEGAGLEIEEMYRVYSPAPPDSASLNASGNRVLLGDAVFKDLNPRQVENLHCVRVFILARVPGTHGAGEGEG